MERRRLGQSDLRIPVIGLGCGNFGVSVDERVALAVVDAAFAHGIDFFDTADIYNGGESERLLGIALRGRRSNAIVATKFGTKMFGGKMAIADDRPGGSRGYMRDRVERSLERLQTDYVDLLYYHRPDGTTPLLETVGYMQELISEGKVRAIGCSNLTEGQLIELTRASSVPIAALQNEYSVVHREPELGVLPLCCESGIGFVAFSPLAGGLLSGRYTLDRAIPAEARLARWHRPVTDELWAAAEYTGAFAAARKCSLVQIALGYLLAQPGVACVLSGASRPEQVTANADAASWPFSEADRTAFDRGWPGTRTR
jgi:aryl-alcohol dehydrogenase-like predicted oxidoreductase